MLEFSTTTTTTTRRGYNNDYASSLLLDLAMGMEGSIRRQRESPRPAGGDHCDDGKVLVEVGHRRETIRAKQDRSLD